MLRLIIRATVVRAIANAMLWLDRHFPDDGDLYDPDDRYWPVGGVEQAEDDSLLDYVVRHDVTVPDDARGLA